MCDASIGLGNSNGGAWSTDGVILFSNQGDIFRVSAAGGVPSKVPLRRGSGAPVWLPNGKFLVTSPGGIWIETLDGAQPKRILPDWSNAAYLPPLTSGSPGYLVFLRGDTLMAQPFDGERGELSGDLVPAADHVGSFGSPYRGAFSASRNGVLVWGRGESVDRELTWVDRTGRKLETVTKPFALRTNPAIALSPDDTKIAIPVAAGNDSDIWIADLTRKTFSRFTFEGSPSAIWSPDGKRILFSAAGGYYLKASDGSGGEELLLKSVPGRGYVYDWSPDGKLISFAQRGAETLFDVWLVSTEGDHKAYPYVQSRFDETWARFSPDGKWMAYSSDESGILQIYVESIPAGKGRWQISTEGGEWSKWRRDGKELFYRQGQKMMVVPISLTTDAVVAGKPQVLFESDGEARFQVTRDGQRFLLTFPAEGASASTPLSIDTNWQAGLKK